MTVLAPTSVPVAAADPAIPDTYALVQDPFPATRALVDFADLLRTRDFGELSAMSRPLVLAAESAGSRRAGEGPAAAGPADAVVRWLAAATPDGTRDPATRAALVEQFTRGTWFAAAETEAPDDEVSGPLLIAMCVDAMRTAKSFLRTAHPADFAVMTYCGYLYARTGSLPPLA